MVEDALQSTRNLHRLVVAVSLITLVFTLSLDLPTEEIRLKARVDRLLATDFTAYDLFVQTKVEKYGEDQLRPIGQAASKRLQQKSARVLQIDSIGELLGSPIHVGKILTKELVLKDISSASLSQLEALNGLSLGQDVQVLKPGTAQLLDTIESFLARYEQSVWRLSELKVTVGSFTGQSFLPAGQVIPDIYFELSATGQFGGAPVFQATFEADVEVLPATSFLRWVAETFRDDEVLAVQGNRLVFLPEERVLPAGYREEKLGALSLRLADAIEKKGPANLSATILGTEVPGLLVVLASPAILLLLAYYLMQHATQLCFLVNDSAEVFRKFAWMPLAIRDELEPARSRLPRIPPAWLLESAGTIIVLPVVSLSTLCLQFYRVGALKSLHVLVLSVAGVLIAWMGLRTIRRIEGIRRRIASRSVVEGR